MAYADKCFYFDWGNREIKLEDFDVYDSISVRSRWLPDPSYPNNSINQVSIELWGRSKEDGKREDDHEIVLDRDAALLLASKLVRAVNELDMKDALFDLYEDVDILKDVHSRLDGDNTFDLEVDRRRCEGASIYTSKKQDMGGILENYVSTPSGQDMLKTMKRIDKEEKV